jgi:hypothetical protein
VGAGADLLRPAASFVRTGDPAQRIDNVGVAGNMCWLPFWFSDYGIVIMFVAHGRESSLRNFFSAGRSRTKMTLALATLPGVQRRPRQTSCDPDRFDKACRETTERADCLVEVVDADV